METFVKEMTGSVGKWADPDGTAMSGQPVTESEQAPDIHPISDIMMLGTDTTS